MTDRAMLAKPETIILHSKTSVWKCYMGAKQYLTSKRLPRYLKMNMILERKVRMVTVGDSLLLVDLHAHIGRLYLR